jgi:hypothetical protein
VITIGIGKTRYAVTRFFFIVDDGVVKVNRICTGAEDKCIKKNLSFIQLRFSKI